MSRTKSAAPNVNAWMRGARASLAAAMTPAAVSMVATSPIAPTGRLRVGFEPRQHLVHSAELVGRLGLRHADDAQPGADDGIEIVAPQGGVDAIDPDGDARRGKMDPRRQRRGDQPAGIGLGVRRHRVLEIEDDGVGAGIEHLPEHALAAAWREQVRAAHDAVRSSRHQITPRAFRSAMRGSSSPSIRP